MEVVPRPLVVEQYCLLVGVIGRGLGHEVVNRIGHAELRAAEVPSQ